MRLLDYHVWIGETARVGGKALRWADDVWDLEGELS
jgi:hypothetical protein